ncbi:MAG: hypothetical protein M1818_008312 [Claussenomyces sp. TS43310]|nr:MAG: hypothetical protein M1818_008312 [Claussenomyces sp. TS43310]
MSSNFMRICLPNVSFIIVSTVISAAASFSPVENINYAVSIPSNTASTGGGNIYFQIIAPSTYQWVGIGIGQQMMGAAIFVVYADGTGNVTISPRAGVGETMPLYNPNAASGTTRLAGSGVRDGMMVANVRYTTAASTLQVNSSSSAWIGAWKSGTPLDTASPSTIINGHDAHAQYTLDLTKAVIALDSNPFLASNSTLGTLESGAAATGVKFRVSEIKNFQGAHGIIMALVVVVLLPLGAMLIPTIGRVWLHAAVQLISLAGLIIGLGLGIYLAHMTDLLYRSAGTTHTVFGTVIICLFILQPVLGLTHHRRFENDGRQGVFGHLHVWYGRTLIILAVVNGGLGLILADNSRCGVIAYGAVAGVMASLYIVIVLRARFPSLKILQKKNVPNVEIVGMLRRNEPHAIDKSR